MKKCVYVKDICIGGGAPISVQTMTNTLTTDIKMTVEQINKSASLGADIVRVSVPDFASAEALKLIIAETNVPIVADIHYDYKIALAAIEAGASKIRLNPSNLQKEGIREVARMAKACSVPIRVGVNQGSFKKREVTAEELALKCLDSAKLLEDEGFTDIVLAVKSSDVSKTIEAYRALDKISQYPLHIGLTESGTIKYGAVKSAVAMGALLAEGIGDTMRISLSGDPYQEVVLGRQILRAVGQDKDFVEVIACPTCARTVINVEEYASKVELATAGLKKQLKVAVMGCAVNGIGESKGAHIGVCGGKGKSILFKDGNAVKTVNNADIISELMKMVEEY
ncbi:MAG: flavodoxin-dependent (E)-4-hydroxy-3-methylbut-2-enyl-diphosphate synthase [Bacillota bacterium]